MYLYLLVLQNFSLLGIQFPIISDPITTSTMPTTKTTTRNQKGIFAAKEYVLCALGTISPSSRWTNSILHT